MFAREGGRGPRPMHSKFSRQCNSVKRTRSGGGAVWTPGTAAGGVGVRGVLLIQPLRVPRHPIPCLRHFLQPYPTPLTPSPT